MLCRFLVSSFPPRVCVEEGKTVACDVVAWVRTGRAAPHKLVQAFLRPPSELLRGPIFSLAPLQRHNPFQPFRSRSALHTAIARHNPTRNALYKPQNTPKPSEDTWCVGFDCSLRTPVLKPQEPQRVAPSPGARLPPGMGIFCRPWSPDPIFTHLHPSPPIVAF